VRRENSSSARIRQKYSAERPSVGYPSTTRLTNHGPLGCHVPRRALRRGAPSFGVVQPSASSGHRRRDETTFFRERPALFIASLCDERRRRTERGVLSSVLRGSCADAPLGERRRRYRVNARSRMYEAVLRRSVCVRSRLSDPHRPKLENVRVTLFRPCSKRSRRAQELHR